MGWRRATQRFHNPYITSPVPWTVLPDVHNHRVRNGYHLTRVGVTNVRKPIEVGRPHGRVHLDATIDVFIDLPGEQRGAHLSRNLEVIGATIEEAIAAENIPSLEAFCDRLCHRLLDVHEYGNRAEVRLSAPFYLTKEHMGLTSQELYHIRAGGVLVRGGAVERRIGVEVQGMTACPCALESVRTILGSTAELVPTHNQRCVVRIDLETTGETEARAEKLVEVAEAALSTSTHEVLKRRSEAELVIAAHRQPRFVEDVTREVLIALARDFPDLPDDARADVEVESFESIHKHNAYAQRSATLGELRTHGQDDLQSPVAGTSVTRTLDQD